MTQAGIIDFKNGIVKAFCSNCNNIFESTVTEDSDFLEEYGEFKNLSIKCGHCPEGLVFINMNLPEGDFEEYDIELSDMPFHEINARKYVRDLMFERRKDLKTLTVEDKKLKRNKGIENVAKFQNAKNEMLVKNKLPTTKTWAEMDANEQLPSGKVPAYLRGISNGAL